MADLRQQLKTLSADMHRQVDAAYGALPLDTSAGYRRFLSAHAHALLPLERLLEDNAVTSLLDDWPRRRRSAALRADLQQLGSEPVPATPVRRTVSTGWCWGALYVLEGSRLGARLLSQRLQAAQPGAPMRYLSHAMNEGLWPAFLQRLQAQASVCDPQQLHLGVSEAFERFLTAAQTQGARHAPIAQP